MASCGRMLNPQAVAPSGRSWRAGPESLLRRIRDIVERGRIDVAQLRLSNLVAWLLARGRDDETPATLSDACSLLEWASRLVLLKARRLDGAWEPAPEEVFEPWAGPPPELPLRRSWLAERVAAGPWCYAAPPRVADASVAPLLAPVAPARLRAVMLAVLARANRPKLKIVPLPRFVRTSVEACCSLIIDRLGRGRTVSFSEVAGEGRDARVAAFLACLILARQGRVEARAGCAVRGHPRAGDEPDGRSHSLARHKQRKGWGEDRLFPFPSLRWGSERRPHPNPLPEGEGRRALVRKREPRATSSGVTDSSAIASE